MSEQKSSGVVWINCPWWFPTYWRIRSKVWWFFQPIFWWLYRRVSHCDSPEYFQSHPKLVRWTGGLKQFCWTFVCGHHFGWSLHMGNIYWKIGRKSIIEDGRK